MEGEREHMRVSFGRSEQTTCGSGGWGVLLCLSLHFLRAFLVFYCRVLSINKSFHHQVLTDLGKNKCMQADFL